MKALMAIGLFVIVWFCAFHSVVVVCTPPVRPGTGNPSPRLPRTSASQLSQLNNGTGTKSPSTRNAQTHRNGNLRIREQQLLNVFEVVVSTLEGKLQRIDNLDKAVEHLMRRVEQLDNRVGDNIHKTESIISKLRNLDNKISVEPNSNDDSSVSATNGAGKVRISSNVLDSRLVALDRKVSDIDSKLEGLKSQIDNNFLAVDDIGAEASEKKPISMNVLEITKNMNAEVINHVSNELGDLRSTTESMDKKLQFHINIVSENIGRVLKMIGDIHEAVVDHHVDPHYYLYNSTTTQPPILKTSKIDALVKQIKPIMSVSEKMDEVWDVVVGTKTSVDDLVPKSDELLTQTQRQERAIGEIHQDLKAKANLIISNLNVVEKRLKKQENDVAALAQRPVPAELLMDPTIDRLVEYDPNRYSLIEEFTEPPQIQTTTSSVVTPTSQSSNQTSSSSSSSTSTSSSSSSSISTQNTVQSNTIPTSAFNVSTNKVTSRKGGIIFPSVKNKPLVGNSTFTTDILSFKDVKGFSCVDLQNAGMRQSGVYYLQIRGTTYWFLKVYCEQDIADGGWTVIQRRDDFGEPRENFNRDWSDYKNGFGDPAKEFWLGNENIYMLTNNEDYSLRVELEDFEGNKRYAQYSHFKIYSEADYYKLEIDGYEGNAGDSLNDPWYGSNNSPFSTYNRDNDRSSLNCASMLKGGWWWKSCGRGLNGLYLHDPQDLTARQGIVWFRWRGWDYTLKKATMMIRPKGLGSATAPLPSTSSSSASQPAASSASSSSGSASQQSSTTTGFVSAAT
ncbi:kinesin-related protein 8 [Sitodiplosis mosellana]|uniref:kinesin-related protein 8 n=1 Tax=Sitodiplosis mosellana TaxID=263140 RepID=UPI002443C112|nr:kinesin-related protein 8 [Sitodiplosis mosellana]